LCLEASTALFSQRSSVVAISLGLRAEQSSPPCEEQKNGILEATKPGSLKDEFQSHKAERLSALGGSFLVLLLASPHSPADGVFKSGFAKLASMG
jgi:hypothetical protein